MQPKFKDPALPRYTEEPFPAYRYLPFVGNQPHPLRDPGGHSYGRDEEYLPGFVASDWCDCQLYLYGVDLFNYGYWWEAHEAWETVWLAAGPETEVGRAVQGLIQLAAAQLKRFTGSANGAQQLTVTGLEKLPPGERVYLGIELQAFSAEVQRCLNEDVGEYPQILLTR